MADDPKDDPKNDKKTPLSEHIQTFVLILVVTIGGLLAARYFGMR